jgi:hypothetical protein
LKTTAVVQFPPATRVVPQEVLDIEKSPAFAPAIAMLLTVTAEAVALVRTTDCDAVLEPTTVLANVRLDGLGVRLLGTTPKPVSAAVWGLLPAESVNCRVAERFPVVVGAKAMLALQLDEAANVDPQVLV